LAPALGALLLSGCAVLWHPDQREGLDADVRALLRGAGALSRHLKLEAIPADASASSLSLLVQLKGHGCAAALSNPSERHGIEGRPDSLRLPRGAFKHLVLSFDPRSQRACLQVS